MLYIISNKKMLDIILAQQCMPSEKGSDEMQMASIIILCIVVIAAIAAIITASVRKGESTSFSADILLAVFSPIMYWILFAFGVVSH